MTRSCPTEDCPWPDEAHVDRCPHHPARLAVLADLRKKVEALPSPRGRSTYDLIYREDVLALIDGKRR